MRHLSLPASTDHLYKSRSHQLLPPLPFACHCSPDWMRKLRPSLHINCSKITASNFTQLRNFASTPAACRFLLQTKRADMAHESTNKKGLPFDRAGLESLVRRTLFYTPSFEIYGGVSGLHVLSNYSVTQLIKANRAIVTTMGHRAAHCKIIFSKSGGNTLCRGRRCLRLTAQC